MSIRPTLLIIDDEKNAREGLQRLLSAKYEVLISETAENGYKIVKEERPDVVLTDLRLPGMSGLEFLDKIKKDEVDARVILFTAYGTVETAVQAMKKGAYHYLLKPVNFDELETVLERAFREKKIASENTELKKEIAETRGTEDIISASKAMKDVLEVVKRVAPSTASVLIEGESGTGKEIAAHLIHRLSQRKNGPFVTVHCAALTETLLSSELFGHEKGAFTGATEKKIGRFERAHTGTIFLDEIGEIKEDLQVKLLRILQNGEFERVGGTQSFKADVRLICATNKNLLEEVKKGNFREDLYYRINVIKIDMPPLRERREDIEPLARHFISHYAKLNNKKINGIGQDAVEALKGYDWPGNVRELKNIVERMVVLAADENLTIENVPADIRHPDSFGKSELWPSGKAVQIRDMEKELIRKKLQDLQGNKSKAAKELGISRRTLYRKIEEYNLL